MDKSAILNDAFRVVYELCSEAQKLKDSNESLQEKIKELRGGEARLKTEKEPGAADKVHECPPKPCTTPSCSPVIPSSAFTAPYKLMMPVTGYHGFPMWQVMSPSNICGYL
ncbi:hypothetical protein EJB05_47237, partial [Eragrostis curvula]